MGLERAHEPPPRNRESATNVTDPGAEATLSWPHLRMVRLRRVLPSIVAVVLGGAPIVFLGTVAFHRPTAPRQAEVGSGERASKIIARAARVIRLDAKADGLDARADSDFAEGRFRAACEVVEEAQRVPTSDVTASLLRQMAHVVCLLEADHAGAAFVALGPIERMAVGPKGGAVRARLAVLVGRVALLAGKTDDAIAAFEHAKVLASGASSADERCAYADALLYGGRAYRLAGRLGEATGEIESLLSLAEDAGAGVDKLVTIRAVAELARVQHALRRRPWPTEASPLALASRLVAAESTEGPRLGEALLAQGEALASEGRFQDAVAVLGRAEKLTTAGSPAAHADAIVALYRAATQTLPRNQAALAQADTAARVATVDALFVGSDATTRKLEDVLDGRN